MDTEEVLTSALSPQPVSIAVKAESSSFQFFTTGALTATFGMKLDHGVLAVGCGTLLFKTGVFTTTCGMVLDVKLALVPVFPVSCGLTPVLEIAEHEMPGLMAWRKEFGPPRPFQGLNTNGSFARDRLWLGGIGRHRSRQQQASDGFVLTVFRDASDVASHQQERITSAGAPMNATSRKCAASHIGHGFEG